MATKPLPPQSVLKQLLRYNPETGRLFWRARPLSYFTEERYWKIWNTKNAGKEALISPTRYGYGAGRLFDIGVFAHRVIWKLVTGCEAEHIDHVDGNPRNNKFKNLRSVTVSENQRNCRISKNNISGVVGVHWYKNNSKWRAEIGVDGKAKHLGYFNDFKKAIHARKAAEMKYNFHPNHGRKQ